MSFLRVEQIMEVARTCVCPHLMDGSTVAAVATGSCWKTAPAHVSEGVLFQRFKTQKTNSVDPKCATLLCFIALNVSCGSVDDFECGNGDCINYSLTCDGMAHCKDKSDEKQSYCGEFVLATA